MKKSRFRLPKDAPREVDDTFDPWEQGRPIPLFVIAVVFALGIWGTLTYFTEHASLDQAVQERVEQKSEVESATGTTSARARQSLAAGAAASAAGLANAGADTLALVQSGKGAAWSCASCHGAAGEGNLSTPRLAGQPAGYLAKQLTDFASGLRDHPSMSVVAKALSSTEIENLAEYYAQIALTSTVIPTLGGDLERGEVIARQGDWKNNVPACVSCHGMSGEGVSPGFPALAGQRPEYILAQLADWHAGVRGNSPQRLMDGIAQRMSPDDMRSVADYFASLPVRAAEAGGQATGAGAEASPAPGTRQEAPGISNS